MIPYRIKPVLVLYNSLKEIGKMDQQKKSNNAHSDAMTVGLPKKRERNSISEYANTLKTISSTFLLDQVK